VELARCLRDLPALDAFATYETLRRSRVETIGGNAAATNRAKAGGPGDKAPMPRPEQMFGPVHRHRIDWDAPAQPRAASQAIDVTASSLPRGAAVPAH
jgi:hypothetical protein